MTISRRHAEWLVFAFFAGVVALVFQQIATDMAAQGIATGGPYDNAAAYPRAVAVALGCLAVAQVVAQVLRRRRDPVESDEIAVPLRKLAKPAAMVAIFAVYLFSLQTVGYHIATPLMLAALMWLCEIRDPLRIVPPALGISFGFAYVFEAWLNVVLPGGAWHLNMVW